MCPESRKWGVVRSRWEGKKTECETWIEDEAQPTIYTPRSTFKPLALQQVREHHPV